VPQAQPQDASDEAALGSRRGDAWPGARKRREERLARRESALRRWEAQAKAARMRAGQPRRGHSPNPVDESPADQAQRHGTAPERPSMPTNTKGWEDGGQAPARVDEPCQSRVACDGPDASNDAQQAEPMGQATRVPRSQAGLAPARDDTGTAPASVAPVARGSDREAAGSARATLGCDPSRATGRQRHHAPEAPVLAEPPSANARMAATVRTPAGQAVDARRQGSVAPGCGQRKAARGCRRCVRRGLANIRGAWRLGGLTHPWLTMWRYGCVVKALEALGRPV